MVTADDTGTDWAALADRLDELATDRRWDCWNMHGDGRRIVPEGYDPLPDCCDAADGAYSLRAAAVGLRRLAQLDTAIGPPMRLMDLMARGTTMDAEGDELAERLTLIYVPAVAEGAEDRGQTHTQTEQPTET